MAWRLSFLPCGVENFAVANFVQSLIIQYEQQLNSSGTNKREDTIHDTEPYDDTKGKACLNMVVLLAELYNLQVVSADLVFDVIRGLLHDDLSELRVEL